MDAERREFTPEIERGNELVKEVKQTQKFERQPDSLVPYDEISELLKNIRELDESLRVTSLPQNKNDLFVSELKRRLGAEFASLSADISGEVSPWEQVVAYYGIPKEDIDGLEGWLGNRLGEVSLANKRNFARVGLMQDRSPVPLGSEILRSRAEKLVIGYLDRMRNVLVKQFPGRLAILETLEKYPLIVDSWQNRSYFNWNSKVIAICTPSVTYMCDGEIYVDEIALISLVGHEFIGHACHDLSTRLSSLPDFLRTKTNATTASTDESISQYFEQRIFEYLIDRPEAVRELNLSKPFESIYREYADTRLVGEYRSKRYIFALLTLARAGKEGFRDNMSIISKYAIEPLWPSNFIENLKHGWDEITGRLHPQYVKELMYVADPVGRIMSEIPDSEKSTVEELMLIGFWTPQGLEDWVRLNIQAES